MPSATPAGGALWAPPANFSRALLPLLAIRVELDARLPRPTYDAATVRGSATFLASTTRRTPPMEHAVLPPPTAGDSGSTGAVQCALASTRPRRGSSRSPAGTRHVAGPSRHSPSPLRRALSSSSRVGLRRRRPPTGSHWTGRAGPTLDHRAPSRSSRSARHRCAKETTSVRRWDRA